MGLNVNWKVFVEGVKNTYPYNKNKLIHIYTGENHYLAIFTDRGFITQDGIELHFFNPVFWQYVDYLPNKVVKRVETKCTKPNNSCEYEDDGYCFDKPVNMKCQYCKKITEYYAYTE